MAECRKERVTPASRLKIALKVLQWSAGGLVVIAAVVVIASGLVAINEKDPKQFLETTQYVFGTLLPLIGTWVGTVLAFYFTKENYEAATASTLETLREARGETLETYLAGKEMRLYDNIVKIELDPKEEGGELNINVKDRIVSKLSASVTRIPVFGEDRKARYMLHESLVYQFLGEFEGDKNNATLKQLVENRKFGKVAENSFAFVGRRATLGTAVKSMKDRARTTGEPCQDVFVTETGDKNEPVLGWLSDRRIQRYSKLKGE